MRIYFEGLGLVSHHFSGVGRYILGILRALDDLTGQALARREAPPDICVLVPFDRVKKYKQYGFRHLQHKVLPFPFEMYDHLLGSDRLPPLDLVCGRGVYIFPRFLAPRLYHSPSVLVVYDLSFERHREYVAEGAAEALSSGTLRSVRRADRVVTISDHALDEIINFYELPATHVSVATPAADSAAFYRRSEEEIRSVKKRYGIEGEYLLTLSNLEPRKNLGTLVEVYCALPPSVRDRFSLVLAGALGWKFQDTMELILDRVEQGFNIQRPSGYVTDEDAPALLSGAAMLIYPSHYEGFGMPPLEALACGTPVIAANNSSLPQVVGQAGHLVASDRPDQIGLAIENVVENLEQETRSASLAGPAQAQKFNWTESAKVYLRLARELGASC